MLAKAQERLKAVFAKYRPQDKVPNEDVEMEQKPAVNEVVDKGLDIMQQVEDDVHEEEEKDPNEVE